LEPELLAAVIPMVAFKKEVFDYIDKLIKEHGVKGAKKALYTIEEAAKILNVKVSRLRQAVFRGEISYVKLGALVRFREEDLQNYISRNLKQVKAT